MIIFVCLLIAPVVFGNSKTTSVTFPLAAKKEIDPLQDQSVIDEAWVGYMIVAPATINLLGQVMVVASTTDVTFESYSPNHVYKFIKYPKSLRATLLQVANGIFKTI